MSRSKKNNNHGMTRRDFFKWSAAAGATGTAIDWLATGPKAAMAAAGGYDDIVKSARNICPYCSVGCAIKIDVDSLGNIVDIYGDPNGLNRGALCAKGSALVELANSSQRVTAWPMRRIGNAGWVNIPWVNAFSEIATHLYNAKLGPTATDKAKHVAFMGSSHMTNEECYIYKKLISLFGTNNIEHQARI